MTSITEAINEYNEKLDGIIERMVSLRKVILDIIINDELTFIETMLPRDDETANGFSLSDGVIYSDWCYIDGYDNILDSETRWIIPVEWFEMTVDELRDALDKYNTELEERHLKNNYHRINYEANFIGYKLVKME